jgi:hypothetical protein
MTLAAVLAVLHQAQTDDRFRCLCLCNPDQALVDYDLTPQEQAVLLAGEPEALELLGVQNTIACQHSLPIRADFLAARLSGRRPDA